MIVESDEYVKPEHPAYDGYTIRRVTKQIADFPDYIEWEVLYNDARIGMLVENEDGVSRRGSPYKSMKQAQAAIKKHMEVCGIPRVVNEAYFDSNGECVPNPDFGKILPEVPTVTPLKNKNSHSALVALVASIIAGLVLGKVIAHVLFGW